VALQDDQGLRLGGIALPELGFMLLSERGQGAFWNGEALPPIPAGEVLSAELLSVNDSAFRRLSGDLPGKLRLSGAFVIDGAFTVKQWFRGLVGMNEKLYDVASSVLAARELGADVRYLNGEPWSEGDLLDDKKIAAPWGILPRGSRIGLG
jgi:fructose-1,6-bisphosphatase/inositol monophosphatase family enzyme